MDRPICQHKQYSTGKTCRHPVKFIWDGWDGKSKLVCGIHAREYTANSLHPFRMRDYKIDEAIKILQVKEE